MRTDDLFGVDPGTLAAILAMMVATYLCRILGVWMMGHVPITPFVRRALAALPGSIVVATVLPMAVRGGPVAMLAIGAGFAAMLVRRNELLALVAGLTAATLARAAGL